MSAAPRPRRADYPTALEHRMAVEAWACTQQCGVIGCTNPATHTWSGHPTCDSCALPGRTPHPGGAARVTDLQTGEQTFVPPRSS